MTLHLEKELFNDLIESTATALNLPTLYIEKDYWVTYVLKRLANSDYSKIAIFKGGTSLSKAYKIIDRFSEDIDLAVITEEKNSNQIKKLIKEIEKTILDENFRELTKHEQVSKGSEFRKTVHHYPKLENGDFGHAVENIILELNSFAQPHPYELQEVSSYIFEFLSQAAPTMIEEYGLEPFNLNVLDYRRTFCEKISAIARASYESDEENIQLKEKIRHFYDIYFLMQEEKIQLFLHSNEFEEMIRKVREDDLKQFNKNNWATVSLSSTKIFTNTSQVINKLKDFYKSNFRDLVYTNDLPIIDKDIKGSIELLSIVLQEKNL